MISYDEALRRITSQSLPPLPVVAKDLHACLGHILAQDVAAPCDSPLFTNSQVDGFALRFDDLKREEGGFSITIASEAIFAKAQPRFAEQWPYAKQAVRIMTGAPVPEWADTIAPVENTTPTGPSLCITSVERGQFLRHKGADRKAGQRLFAKGTRLLPEQIMVAATFGLATLPVQAQPSVLIVTTGDELVEPGDPLPLGAVHNASKYFLQTSCAALGLHAHKHVHLGDDEERAYAELGVILDTFKPQVILSTGAVSAGLKDFVPALTARLGFEQVFHKVAMRPGKPVYFARRPEVFWLGLPGNAISTFVGWWAFVRPLLATHFALASPTVITARLCADSVTKPSDLRAFFRGTYKPMADGGFEASIAGSQNSAFVASSIDANAIIVLPEGTDGGHAGQNVRVIQTA